MSGYEDEELESLESEEESELSCKALKNHAKIAREGTVRLRMRLRLGR